MEHKPHDPDNKYTDEEYANKVHNIQNVFFYAYLLRMRLYKLLNTCGIILLLVILYLFFKYFL